MPSFTKKIVVNNYGQLTFAFTRVYTKETQKYFVLITDNDNKLHQFTMQPCYESWIIEGAYNLPQWLTGLEVELEKAILTH